MTRLAEVYEGLGEETTQRQLYAGTGLFAAGALLLVAGVLVATTGVLSPLGPIDWQPWEPVGVLVGLGLPAAAVGVFVLLPSSREVRAAAVVGASVAFLGVTLFAFAYPARWLGNSPELTLFAGLVYLLGTITTVRCLVTAVAGFEPRTDAGGTVHMEVSRGEETRVVEVDGEDLSGTVDGAGTPAAPESVVDPGPASVTDGAGTSSNEVTGLLDDGATQNDATADRNGATADRDGTTADRDGTTADRDGTTADRDGTTADREGPSGSSITERTAGAVRSATDAVDDAVRSTTDAVRSTTGAVDDAVRSTTGAVDDAIGPDGSTGEGTAGNSTPQPASDGGATEPGIRTPADDAEVMSARSDPADTADTYCGNCEHFRYVQTSRGIRPFCELDDGIMDDVEACDRWEPNRMD